jgi:hypothetical protein
LRSRNASPQVAQQVSLSQQAFRTGFSQHYLGVCCVRHAQAHLHWQVRLDETGHNGTIWALSCEDKVNAGSSALSCQPRDQFFKGFPLVSSS